MATEKSWNSENSPKGMQFCKVPIMGLYSLFLSPDNDQFLVFLAGINVQLRGNPGLNSNLTYKTRLIDKDEKHR